jgi:hypothetical protein
VTAGIHAQGQCGCAYGTPCYWSSKPSSSADVKENMTFKLRIFLTAVVGFSITPYQVMIIII